MVKKVSEILQGIAAIWLVFVAFTIFAEVTFRNFGLFLGADQIVQNSVPAIVFLQVYCLRNNVKNNSNIRVL